MVETIASTAAGLVGETLDSGTFEAIVRNQDEIDRLLAEAEGELARLNTHRAELLAQITALQREKVELRPVQEAPSPPASLPSVTNQSPQEVKIALFRSLFRGREDVYPKRFESLKTGKTGYQPVCRNAWVEKPELREFLPVTDGVVRNHLLGMDPQDRLGRDFTIGVYPMLPDEMCWFLAADFDKAFWQEDARAFLATCKLFNVPAALERSRSGNGGHIWIFFSEPVPVALARKMGAFLLTQTMDRRPEIGLDSYDRFFPSAWQLFKTPNSIKRRPCVCQRSASRVSSVVAKISLSTWDYRAAVSTNCSIYSGLSKSK